MQTMSELAERFDVLQHRFVDFSDKIPTLLRVWLSGQVVAVVGLSLDSLSDQLFPPCNDAPWVKSIACFALSDQLACVPYVQCSGSSVLFTDVPGTLSIQQWPARASIVLGRPTVDEIALRRRNAFLEVRVVDLEAKAAAPVLAKHSVPARLISTEDTLHFLLEKRFEAEDAIAVLKRMQTEHIGRSFVVDSIGVDQCKKVREQARVGAKKARHELAMAAEEIVRLGAEIETLRSSTKSKQAVDVDSSPIVPKRALIVAGFWNVSHNDVLRITPYLVEKFENSGKKAIKRKDSQVCFPAKDRETVINVVVQVMAEMLPSYSRVAT